MADNPALAYVSLLLVSAGLSAVIALLAAVRRASAGAPAAVGLMLALCAWCVTYALALASPDPVWAGYWSRLRFAFIPLSPVLWLTLALQYTGRRRWLSWRCVAGVLAIPAVTVALVWVPGSDLMFTGPVPGAPPPFAGVDLRPGPWYWVHIAYSYSLLLLGIGLLVGWFGKAWRQYQNQMALLVAAAAVPFAGSILSELDVLPNPHLDITPFCFVLSALASMAAIFRYGFLSLTPVARDAVLEKMTDGVVVLDWQDRVADLNPAAQAIMGVPGDEVVGRPMGEVLEVWSHLAPRLRMLSHLREEIALHVAGRERFFDLAVSPLQEPAKHRGGRLVMLHEITDLKATQLALQHNEQRYRVLFETSTDAIFLQTLDGRILDCNESACEQYGYTREELRQLSVSDLGPSSAAARLPRHFAGDPAQGGVLAETEGRRRNGEVFPAEVRTRLVKVGEAPHVVAFVRDITDRKRAEEQWMRNDTLLRSMAENSPLAFYVVDGRNDQVLYYNQRLVEMWGVAGLGGSRRTDGPAAGAAVSAAALAQVTDAEAFSRLWERLRGEIPRTVVEQDLALADGRILHWFSAQVRDFEGRYFGRLHIFQDITDRKRAEDAQRLAAVGQLAAGVAHEFNNILCSMRLRADLARLRQDPERYEELTRNVVEGTQRGAQICDDMLRFARPAQPTRLVIPIESPLEEALSLCEAQLATTRVKVRRHYSSGGRLVSVDPGQMEQVFLNLVLNACHAMPGGGTLALTTSFDPAANGQVVVEVSDTGTGIRPEHLARIFEPFFTTKGRLGESDTPGTGLGLSVSHGLLQAHGATLGVRSEWGHGTTFEVRFAAHTAGVGAPVRAMPPAMRGPRAGPPVRVLLAEDETEVRDTVMEALQTQGYEVVATSDIAEALDTLRDQEFDLIITDLLMPQGDGLDLVGAAALLPSRPPVLVITGKASDNLDQQLRVAGATRWMIKPFGLTELLTTVMELSRQPGRQ